MRSTVDEEERWLKVFSITQMASASISILASVTLLCMILRSHRSLSTPLHRLLLGLSISDILSSLAMSFSSTLSPPDHIGWNPIGNMTLCRIQGYLFLVGHIASPFYNCSLCVYYLIEIRFTRFIEHMNKIEILLQATPILIAVTLSTSLLAVDGIQPYVTSCFPAFSYPYGCQFNEEVECEEGFLDRVVFLAIYVFLLFVLVPVTIFVSMTVIYLEVAGHEERTNLYRYSFRPRASVPARRNRLAARNRAAAYSLAWFLSWAIYFVIVLYAVITGYKHSTPIQMVWLHIALFPLQGLFNFMVYLQPRLTDRLNHYAHGNITHPKRFFLAIGDAVTSRGRAFTTGSGGSRRGNSSLYRQTRAQRRRRSLQSTARQSNQTIINHNHEEEKTAVEAFNDIEADTSLKE